VMVVGILALQGAFAEHEKVLDSLEEDWFEIRSLQDLNRSMDGIILPGGESTVQGKLLNDFGMKDKLRNIIVEGLPVFGTCAGLILLSERIADEDTVHLGTMPMIVRRNGYGRQLGSFSSKGRFGRIQDVDMEFIRAPYIESVGDGVEILSIVEGRTVAARFDKQIVTAFHPELTDDVRVHQFFLDIINN